MKNNEIRFTQELLNSLTVKDLTLDSMRKLIQLSKKLNESQEILVQMQQQIMKSYNIEEKHGTFTWVDHKEEKEINAKIQELLTQDISKYISDVCNFMTEDEFIKACKDNLNISQITYLESKLVKRQSQEQEQE